MSNVTFTLFRLTVHPTAPLFPPTTPKSELLTDAIRAQPSVTQGRRLWRIANVADLEPGALRFRFGRDGRRSLPREGPRGDFVDEEVEIAPFVDVVVDTRLEVCAIGDRHELNNSPSSVAWRLQEVLSESNLARARNISFNASPLKEPRTFLERLENARYIRRLWVTTSRPNPFDAEEDFVRPVSKTIEEIGADAAKTSWSGGNIQGGSPAVREIVKSTAANGGDAGALLVEKGEERAQTVTLTNSFVSFKLKLDATAFRRALDSLRDTYDRIRHRSNR